MFDVVNAEFHHPHLLLEFRVHLSILELLFARSLVEVDNAMRVLNGDIADVANRGIAVITKVLHDSFLLEFMATMHRAS